MIKIHFVTPSSGIKIKFTGIVDIKQLYKEMKVFLEERGFAKEETIEKSYVERIKPNGKQIEILWGGGKTITDYFKYKIRVTFLLNGINEVEVQRDGYKIKLFKGDFQISITAFIEEGSKEWESLGPFAKLYRNLFAKKQLKIYLGDLYGKVIGFQNYIKKFLELRT